MPTLSVLVLCWNQKQHLEQSIGSLAAQTDRDFEVVFLDNHSSDGSLEEAERLLTETGLSFTLLRNDQPLGIAANLNRLAAAASGQWLAFLACDDWYEPDYARRMIEAARAHPEAGLLYADGWIYWDEEQRLERIDSSKHLSGNVLRPLVAGEEPFFFVGTCVPAAVFREVGGFDDSLQIEDLDFFIRITRKYPVQRVDAPLVTYRKSRNAVSADTRFMIAGWEQYRAKHRGTAAEWDVDAWMAEMYRRYAALSVDQGRYRLAAELLGKSLRMRPFAAKTYRSWFYLLRKALGRSGKLS